jgi:hypothetical protein
VEKSVEILIPRLEKGLRFNDKHQIALKMGSFQLTEKTQFMCHIFIFGHLFGLSLYEAGADGTFPQKIFEFLVGIGFCKTLSLVCLLIKASQILIQ